MAATFTRNLDPAFQPKLRGAFSAGQPRRGGVAFAHAEAGRSLSVMLTFMVPAEIRRLEVIPEAFTALRPLVANMVLPATGRLRRRQLRPSSRSQLYGLNGVPATAKLL